MSEPDNKKYEFELTPEGKEIVDKFFAVERDAHIDLYKLGRVLGKDVKPVIDEIWEWVEKEVEQGKAVRTHGCVGDDGAGLNEGSEFMKAYDRADKEGIIWYHFDSEMMLFGISKHLPNYSGSAEEIF